VLLREIVTAQGTDNIHAHLKDPDDVTGWESWLNF